MTASSSPPSPSPQQAAQPSFLPTLSRDRFTLEYRTAADDNAVKQTGQEVIAGLTQTPKTLPPKYFYDDHGSQLFEAITELPEYYLTRTERDILTTYADAIADEIGPCDLVELGSGSSSKTRILLDAYRRKGYDLRYVPVDVSGGILEDSARHLLSDYPDLMIHGLVSTYQAVLSDLPKLELPRRAIAFIGSTLGNLPPAQCHNFFHQVSAALEEGDYFLLGVDLHKDRETLEAAYDDAQGVTAAFNLNMLSHLNWRFQGDFNPLQFRHVALYNERDRRIEMYIESLVDQTVTLSSLNLTVTFRQGERLLSEISRKFDISSLSQELAQYGLPTVKTFTDLKQWFAIVVCQKQ